MPQDKSQSEPPARRRPGLALRLGILGAFIAALGASLASFALFGCFCPPTLPPSEWEKKSNNPPVGPGPDGQFVPAPTTAIPAK